MGSVLSRGRWVVTQPLPIELPNPPLPPGVRLGAVLAGKYRLDAVLGTGATGVVVGARHLQLDQRVAIKFMSSPLMDRRNGVQRFLLEARNAARIRCEHVVRVFDVGALDDGTPYTVMEYLDGEDLRQLLDRRGSLPLTEALDYILQVGEAVAAAHVAGIVHRDLQPGNLFCCASPDGSPLVKVLDFGASKLLQRVDNTLRPVSLTGPYVVGGLPFYSAPEQFCSPLGGDTRADIWALGVILYELVCGRTPFSGETAIDIVSHVARAAPLPMHILRPDVPAQLDAVVSRALAKEPAARHATVAELARSLAPFADPRSLGSVERIERLFRESCEPSADRERVSSRRRAWTPRAPLVVAAVSLTLGALFGSVYQATRSRRVASDIRAHAVVVPEALTAATPAPRREARGDAAGATDAAGFVSTGSSSSSSRQQVRSADTFRFGGLR
jgi:serine/threonine-protein kinase